MLNEDQLDQLLTTKEGYKLELKQKFNKNITKEVCAFANSSGGRIIIGVSDTGQKIGVKNDNHQLSKIQDTLNQINPFLQTTVYPLKNLIIIEVPEGPDKPYAAPTGFFLRTGPNSQKMDRDQIISFLEKEGRIKFDEMINEKGDFLDNFSPPAFARFLKLAGIEADLEPKNTLRNLSCLELEDKLTNAGVLMFAKDISSIMNQATIVCVLYQGEEKLKVIDRKDLAVDLIKNLDDSLNFILRNTKTEYVFSDQPTRKDVADYPLKAVREALVNAACHRDYFNRGSQIMIEIFSNRLEITSPGGLPTGLNPKDFGNRSLARNPLLASLLQRVNYAERLGTGINRIKAEIENHPKPLLVDFKYCSDSFFVVVFSQIKNNQQIITHDIKLIKRLVANQEPKKIHNLLWAILELKHQTNNWVYSPGNGSAGLAGLSRIRRVLKRVNGLQGLVATPPVGSSFVQKIFVGFLSESALRKIKLKEMLAFDLDESSSGKFIDLWLDLTAILDSLIAQSFNELFKDGNDRDRFIDETLQLFSPIPNAKNIDVYNYFLFLIAIDEKHGLNLNQKTKIKIKNYLK